LTLLPIEPVRVTVPPQDCWPDEENAHWCANPDCDQYGSETHHVVRRSETAGPKRWVSIDGLVICNEVRVCSRCHCNITEHRAWIRYEEGTGWVWWAARPPDATADPSEFYEHPKSGRLFRRVGPLKGAEWNPVTGLVSCD
jgi:hypothetical protein